jgi:hypothetical protein
MLSRLLRLTCGKTDTCGARSGALLTPADGRGAERCAFIWFAASEIGLYSQPGSLATVKVTYYDRVALGDEPLFETFALRRAAVTAQLLLTAGISEGLFLPTMMVRKIDLGPQLAYPRFRV